MLNVKVCAYVCVYVRIMRMCTAPAMWNMCVREWGLGGFCIYEFSLYQAGSAFAALGKVCCEMSPHGFV